MKGFIKFIKIFSIVLGTLVGILGISLGIMYLTGMFNKANVEPEDIVFSSQLYEESGDFEMLITSTTEGVTEKDITLSFVNGNQTEVNGEITDGVIIIPKNVQIGVPFKVKLSTELVLHNGERVAVVKGGHSEIKATSTNIKISSTTTKVSVDVPVVDTKIVLYRPGDTEKTEPLDPAGIVSDSDFIADVEFFPENSRYKFSNPENEKRIFFETLATQSIYIERVEGQTNMFHAKAATFGSDRVTLKAKVFKTANSEDEALKKFPGGSENDILNEMNELNSVESYILDSENKLGIVIKEYNVGNVEVSNDRVIQNGDVINPFQFVAGVNKRIYANYSDESFGVNIKADSNNVNLESKIKDIGLRVTVGGNERDDLFKIIGGTTKEVIVDGKQLTYHFPNIVRSDINKSYWEFYTSGKIDNASIEMILLVDDVIFETKTIEFGAKSIKNEDSPINFVTDTSDLSSLTIVADKQEGAETPILTPARVDLYDYIAIPSQNVYKTAVFFAYFSQSLTDEEVAKLINYKSVASYIFDTASGTTYRLYEIDGNILEVKDECAFKILFCTVFTDYDGSKIYVQNGLGENIYSVALVSGTNTDPQFVDVKATRTMLNLAGRMIVDSKYFTKDTNNNDVIAFIANDEFDVEIECTDEADTFIQAWNNHNITLATRRDNQNWDSGILEYEHKMLTPEDVTKETLDNGQIREYIKIHLKVKSYNFPIGEDGVQFMLTLKYVKTLDLEPEYLDLNVRVIKDDTVTDYSTSKTIEVYNGEPTSISFEVLTNENYRDDAGNQIGSKENPVIVSQGFSSEGVETVSYKAKLGVNPDKNLNDADMNNFMNNILNKIIKDKYGRIVTGREPTMKTEGPVLISADNTLMFDGIGSGKVTASFDGISTSLYFEVQSGKIIDIYKDLSTDSTKTPTNDDFVLVYTIDEALKPNLSVEESINSPNSVINVRKVGVAGASVPLSSLIKVYYDNEVTERKNPIGLKYYIDVNSMSDSDLLSLFLSGMIKIGGNAPSAGTIESIKNFLNQYAENGTNIANISFDKDFSTPSTGIAIPLIARTDQGVIRLRVNFTIISSVTVENRILAHEGAEDFNGTTKYIGVFNNEEITLSEDNIIINKVIKVDDLDKFDYNTVSLYYKEGTSYRLAVNGDNGNFTFTKGADGIIGNIKFKPTFEGQIILYISNDIYVDNNNYGIRIPLRFNVNSNFDIKVKKDTVMFNAPKERISVSELFEIVKKYNPQAREILDYNQYKIELDSSDGTFSLSGTGADMVVTLNNMLPDDEANRYIVFKISVVGSDGANPKIVKIKATPNIQFNTTFNIDGMAGFTNFNDVTHLVLVSGITFKTYNSVDTTDTNPNLLYHAFKSGDNELNIANLIENLKDMRIFNFSTNLGNTSATEIVPNTATGNQIVFGTITVRILSGSVVFPVLVLPVDFPPIKYNVEGDNNGANNDVANANLSKMLINPLASNSSQDREFYYEVYDSFMAGKSYNLINNATANSLNIFTKQSNLTFKVMNDCIKNGDTIIDIKDSTDIYAEIVGGTTLTIKPTSKTGIFILIEISSQDFKIYYRLQILPNANIGTNYPYVINSTQNEIEYLSFKETEDIRIELEKPFSKLDIPNSGAVGEEVKRFMVSSTSEDIQRFDYIMQVKDIVIQGQNLSDAEKNSLVYIEPGTESSNPILIVKQNNVTKNAQITFTVRKQYTSGILEVSDYFFGINISPEREVVYPVKDNSNIPYDKNNAGYPYIELKAEKTSDILANIKFNAVNDGSFQDITSELNFYLPTGEYKKPVDFNSTTKELVAGKAITMDESFNVILYTKYGVHGMVEVRLKSSVEVAQINGTTPMTIETSGDKTINLDDYFKVIQKKTGEESTKYYYYAKGINVIANPGGSNAGFNTDYTTKITFTAKDAEVKSVPKDDILKKYGILANDANVTYNFSYGEIQNGVFIPKTKTESGNVVNEILSIQGNTAGSLVSDNTHVIVKLESIVYSGLTFNFGPTGMEIKTGNVDFSFLPASDDISMYDVLFTYDNIGDGLNYPNITIENIEDIDINSNGVTFIPELSKVDKFNYNFTKLYEMEKGVGLAPDEPVAPAAEVKQELGFKAYTSLGEISDYNYSGITFYDDENYTIENSDISYSHVEGQRNNLISIKPVRERKIIYAKAQVSVSYGGDSTGNFFYNFKIDVQSNVNFKPESGYNSSETPYFEQDKVTYGGDFYEFDLNQIINLDETAKSKLDSTAKEYKYSVTVEKFSASTLVEGKFYEFDVAEQTITLDTKEVNREYGNEKVKVKITYGQNEFSYEVYVQFAVVPKIVGTKVSPSPSDTELTDKESIFIDNFDAKEELFYIDSVAPFAEEKLFINFTLKNIETAQTLRYTVNVENGDIELVNEEFETTVSSVDSRTILKQEINLVDLLGYETYKSNKDNLSITISSSGLATDGIVESIVGSTSSNRLSYTYTMDKTTLTVPTVEYRISGNSSTNLTYYVKLPDDALGKVEGIELSNGYAQLIVKDNSLHYKTTEANNYKPLPNDVELLLTQGVYFGKNIDVLPTSSPVIFDLYVNELFIESYKVYVKNSEVINLLTHPIESTAGGEERFYQEDIERISPTIFNGYQILSLVYNNNSSTTGLVNKTKDIVYGYKITENEASTKSDSDKFQVGSQWYAKLYTDVITSAVSEQLERVFYVNYSKLEKVTVEAFSITYTNGVASYANAVGPDLYIQKENIKLLPRLDFRYVAQDGKVYSIDYNKVNDSFEYKKSTTELIEVDVGSVKTFTLLATPKNAGDSVYAKLSLPQGQTTKTIYYSANGKTEGITESNYTYLVTQTNDEPAQFVVKDGNAKIIIKLENVFTNFTNFGEYTYSAGNNVITNSSVSQDYSTNELKDFTLQDSKVGNSYKLNFKYKMPTKDATRDIFVNSYYSYSPQLNFMIERALSEGTEQVPPAVTAGSKPISIIKTYGIKHADGSELTEQDFAPQSISIHLERIDNDPRYPTKHSDNGGINDGKWDYYASISPVPSKTLTESVTENGITTIQPKTIDWNISVSGAPQGGAIVKFKVTYQVASIKVENYILLKCMPGYTTSLVNSTGEMNSESQPEIVLERNFTEEKQTYELTLSDVSAEANLISILKTDINGGTAVTSQIAPAFKYYLEESENQFSKEYLYLEPTPDPSSKIIVIHDGSSNTVKMTFKFATFGFKSFKVRLVDVFGYELIYYIKLQPTKSTPLYDANSDSRAIYEDTLLDIGSKYVDTTVKSTGEAPNIVYERDMSETRSPAIMDVQRVIFVSGIGNEILKDSGNNYYYENEEGKIVSASTTSGSGAATASETPAAATTDAYKQYIDLTKTYVFDIKLLIDGVEIPNAFEKQKPSSNIEGIDLDSTDKEDMIYPVSSTPDITHDVFPRYRLKFLDSKIWGEKETLSGTVVVTLGYKIETTDTLGNKSTKYEKCDIEAGTINIVKRYVTKTDETKVVRDGVNFNIADYLEAKDSLTNAQLGDYKSYDDIALKVSGVSGTLSNTVQVIAYNVKNRSEITAMCRVTSVGTDSNAYSIINNLSSYFGTQIDFNAKASESEKSYENFVFTVRDNGTAENEIIIDKFSLDTGVTINSTEHQMIGIFDSGGGLLLETQLPNTFNTKSEMTLLEIVKCFNVADITRYINQDVAPIIKIYKYTGEGASKQRVNEKSFSPAAEAHFTSKHNDRMFEIISSEILEGNVPKSIDFKLINSLNTDENSSELYLHVNLDKNGTKKFSLYTHLYLSGRTEGFAIRNGTINNYSYEYIGYPYLPDIRSINYTSDTLTDEDLRTLKGYTFYDDTLSVYIPQMYNETSNVNKKVVLKLTLEENISTTDTPNYQQQGESIYKELTNISSYDVTKYVSLSSLFGVVIGQNHKINVEIDSTTQAQGIILRYNPFNKDNAGNYIGWHYSQKDIDGADLYATDPLTGTAFPKQTPQSVLPLNAFIPSTISEDKILVDDYKLFKNSKKYAYVTKYYVLEMNGRHYTKTVTYTVVPKFYSIYTQKAYGSGDSKVIEASKTPIANTNPIEYKNEFIIPFGTWVSDFILQTIRRNASNDPVRENLSSEANGVGLFTVSKADLKFEIYGEAGGSGAITIDDNPKLEDGTDDPNPNYLSITTTSAFNATSHYIDIRVFVKVNGADNNYNEGEYVDIGYVRLRLRDTTPA